MGTSTLTITGTSGTLNHTAGVTLNVSATPPPRAYTLTASTGHADGVGWQCDDL